MKILITGSSGFLGQALVSFFSKNHRVYKLVRIKENLKEDEIEWDPGTGLIAPYMLEGFDAVIHLAGESIASRWTKQKKKEILDSRVIGTQLLCQGLAQLDRPPSVLISASAIGFYGDRGNELLTEQSSKGTGFLSDVCSEWEASTELAEKKGIRVVHARFGIILSPEGGALKKMLTPFKLGLGGKLGSGSQYMSWIALEDVLRVIDYSIQHNHIKDALNVVSPHPLTNEEFTKTLGNLLDRSTFFTVPGFMVKLVFGEMGDALLLASQKVVPQTLEKAGFTFKFPTLKEALRDMA